MALNSYVRGNRVTVTATVEALPETDPPTLVTPSNWKLYVRNIASGDLLIFSRISGVDTLPTGVDASMNNPSTGVIEFVFNVPDFGLRALRFEGSGTVTVADESQFMVDRSEVV